jgi:cellulose synthase operon protein C
MARFDYPRRDPRRPSESSRDHFPGRTERGRPACPAAAGGDEAAGQQKSEAAAALVGEVLAADSKNADALALRARMRMQAGDYERATRDLRQALNQQPQSVPCSNCWPRCSSAKARSISPTTSMFRPSGLRTMRPLSRCAMPISCPAAATGARRAILSESLSRAPNNADVLSALARVRLMPAGLGRRPDVAELLKARGDRSGTSDQILGAALLGQQKFDQSIEI